MFDIEQEDKKKKNTYAAKHDFMSVTLSQLDTPLELAIKAKLVPIIVGAPGIGKTQKVNQVANKLNYEYRPVMISQLVQEDVNGIPVPDMDKEIVKFLKNELFPTGRETRPVLLFFDELLLGDQPVVKTLFQLFTDRRIGSYKLPESCRLVAATNPDGGAYQTIKPSPQLRRRLKWIEVRFECNVWLNWAMNSDVIDPIVIEYIKRNPDDCLNEAAMLNDKVYASPAGWEDVSKILSVLSNDDRAEDVLPLIGGTVGSKIADKFIKFYTTFSHSIDPTKIMNDYDNIKAQIQKLGSQGRVDALTGLCNAIVINIMGLEFSIKNNSIKKKYDAILQNICQFFVDLPNDVAVMFAKNIKETYEQSNKIDEYIYFQDVLQEHPGAAEKMIEMSTIVARLQEETP